MAKDRKKIEWYHFDASKKTLGRMSTEIAGLLMGKDRTDFSRNSVPLTKVIVTNTDKVKVTGNKEAEKMYYRYSGYPGGLKKRSLAEQKKRDSRKIVESAVYGMLPKNSLREKMIKNLKTFKGDDHPHKAQINN